MKKKTQLNVFYTSLLALVFFVSCSSFSSRKMNGQESSSQFQRSPSSLSSQRYQCELNSSKLTLLMRGDTGIIDGKIDRTNKPLPAKGDEENLEKLVHFVEENPNAISHRRFPWLDNFLASEKQRLFSLSISLDPINKINDSYMVRYLERNHLRQKNWDKNIVERAKTIDALYEEVERQNQLGMPPQRVALEQVKKEMKTAESGRVTTIFKEVAGAQIRAQGAAKGCRDLGVTKPDECAKAAIFNHDKILRPTHIGSYPGQDDVIFADVSNLEMTVKVLDSSIKDPYLSGLRNYEQKFVNHLAAPRQVATNIFQDLVASFLEAGDTNEAAQTKAIEVLSVVSTNGSDFILNEQLFNRIYRDSSRSQTTFEPTNPKFVTLVRISMALPYFDLLKPGNLYSLPENVISECNTSKYYHFWMSAYLMRRLMGAGFSKEAAASAILVNHVGYRALYDPFASKFDESSAPGMILRTDLASVYAGIVFASRLGTPKQGTEISFQEIYDSIKVDPSYNDVVGDLAGTVIPSAKIYGEFMKNLGIVSLWKKLHAEL